MLEGQATLGDLEHMSIDDVDTHIRFLDAWQAAGSRINNRTTRQ